MSDSSTVIARIREAFDPRHALELLQRAISIPSVTGDESNFAGWLKGELTALGVEASSAEFAEGRPNVWGLRKRRSGADTLLLIGHTDTVRTRGWKERWAGSERESPFSGAVVDGAVCGRGSSDLKAGICMTLEAVRLLPRIRFATNSPTGRNRLKKRDEENRGLQKTGFCGTSTLVKLFSFRKFYLGLEIR
jgi:acetylornithine deacetylase